MNAAARIVLKCPACSQQTSEELARWLRSVGMLRRTSELEPELLWALLPAAAARASCESCGHTGLEAREGDAADADEADWPQAATCKACGAVIPPERQEIFPDAKYCARCQQGREKPVATAREFCPRCGSEMTVKSSGRGGITRYELSCSSCGHHSR